MPNPFILFVMHNLLTHSSHQSFHGVYFSLGSINLNIQHTYDKHVEHSKPLEFIEASEHYMKFSRIEVRRNTRLCANIRAGVWRRYVSHDGDRVVQILTHYDSLKKCFDL